MKKIFLIFGFALCILFASQGANAQTNSDYEKAVAEYMKAANIRETVYVGIVEGYTAMNMPISNMEAVANEILDSFWPEYISGMAEILKNYYTLEELNAIIDFYKSPVGAKFAKYSPQITQDASKIMMQPEILEKIQRILMQHLN